MGFWIPWGIDAVVAAVFVVFFFVGLADGTVSSFNIALWLVVLAAAGAVVGGSLELRSRGQTGAAIALVAVLAVPSVLVGILLVAFVVLQPKF